MPSETRQAVNWALQQTVIINGVELQVTKETCNLLVDKIREYFNTNNVSYETFSYNDLETYLGVE